MKEIEGTSFEKSIQDLHSGIQENSSPTEGITLRRCISDLLEVCEAMSGLLTPKVLFTEISKPENITSAPLEKYWLLIGVW